MGSMVNGRSVRVFRHLPSPVMGAGTPAALHLSRAATNVEGMNPGTSSITPRRIRFDWSDRPVEHWIPGEPDATYVLNAMHLIFPEGERAFCRVLSSALGHVRDEQTIADIKGFIAQEGLHARAHHGAFVALTAGTPHLEHIQARVTRTMRRLLGDGRTTNRYLLMWRLASVAAAEHLTTALGEWTMTGERFAEHGCDPQMAALVKWHGAEEIEHRSVAFDAHRAVQTKLAYPTRVVAMLFWLPILTVLWAACAQSLLRHNTVSPRRRVLSPRAVRRGIRRGLIPDIPMIARGAMTFCRPGYHPASHVSDEVVATATAWLAGGTTTRYTTT